MNRVLLTAHLANQEERMANERDELLDHDYDGIQEYDNDLPRWWLNIFWLTAIFAVVYTGWTHFVKEPQHEALAKQLESLKQVKQTQTESSGAKVLDADGLLALTTNKDALATGEKVFTGKCVACHATGGAGLVGPNLTDDYWIHGGKITDLRQVVQKGVVEKGMISWEGLLTTSEIDSVVAYIWTLHGTNPENPKAPEGELVKRDS